MLSRLARVAWAPDFRGKARLVRALPVHGRHVFQLPWGRMDLSLDDRAQRQMAFGSFDRKEVRILRRMVPQGGVALDVGAHVGFYTVLMGNLVGPDGSVVAVEPVPENFAELSRNVELNGFPSAHLVRAAASNRTGTARLSKQHDEPTWGSLELSREGEHIEVPLFRLDEYLHEIGVDHVSFVKVDVEGHELPVLEGLGGFLHPPAGPSLMVEMLAGRTKEWQAILDHLGDLAYRPTYVRGRAGQLRHNVFFSQGEEGS